MVIGDALIDEIVTLDGTSEFVGGAALNVAVGLSILGVSTSLIAMVGDDADGDTIRAFLHAHNVTLIASPAPLGSARASSVRTNGEPSYSFNAAALARRIQFTSDGLAALAAATLVLVSSFPFDDPTQAAALRASVAFPRDRLVVDVNPRGALLKNPLVFREEFEATARSARLVKIGDEDAGLLYQQSPDEVASRLLTHGAATIFSTFGREGAAIRTAEGLTIRRPITELAGDIIDTMGAGDATLASIAASMLELPPKPSEEQWGAALDNAMFLAAATCRVAGATLPLVHP
ncbi:MAG TPA: PfkB family carbohydrate kinase [Galbitalea sp.]